MSFEVHGRTVIVNGGSRGIGFGIAEVFADAGAHVTIVGRDRDVAAQAATRLADRGASVDCVIADISKPSQCARMADEVMATRGGIDVLCANAGMFTGKKLADMTEEDYDETFDLNTKGCLFSVQACLPALAGAGHGRVVVTPSITGPMTGSLVGRTTARARQPSSVSSAPRQWSWRRRASRSTRSCRASSTATRR